MWSGSRWVALVAVGLAVGCRSSQDPIAELLIDLESAVEAQDAGRVEALLTTDFQGQGGMRKGDVRPTLARYFAAYENVSVEVYEVAVERGDDEATRVHFRVDFNGQPLKIGALAGFLPPSAMYRFDLTVRQDGKAWRVAAADWEDLAPPGG